MHMVFQPIFDLDQRRVVAVEALARFRGPPSQTPDVWFSDANEVGLGIELEHAAVHQAIEQLSQIPASIDLSLNVSPGAASANGFRELVATTNPERIIVEITEHAPIEDYDGIATVFDELRGLGLRLAVDDAGAGFASLRHILRLDPQFIKLDRTLIDGIATDRSRQALAAGLISFAEKTEAAIIAEGIETREEIDELRALGVAYGQGFRLGRPASLDAMALSGPLPGVTP